MTPGDNVIVEGDIGREMFFLEAGEVQVVLGDTNRVVATLKSGAFFGEMALIDDSSRRRTASILAATFCDVQVLAKEDFDAIMEDWPEYLPRLKKIADQRRGMTANVLQEEKTIKSPANSPAKASTGKSFATAMYAVHRKKGASKFKTAGLAALSAGYFKTGTKSNAVEPLSPSTRVAMAENSPMLNRMHGRTVSGDKKILESATAGPPLSPESSRSESATRALSGDARQGTRTLSGGVPGPIDDAHSCTPQRQRQRTRTLSGDSSADGTLASMGASIRMQPLQADHVSASPGHDDDDSDVDDDESFQLSRVAEEE